MTDVTLRPATPDDADAIAVVHRAARREAMPWLPVLHSDEETTVAERFKNEAIAGHIGKFWDPRMRSRLHEFADAGVEALDPLVVAAVKLLR